MGTAPQVLLVKTALANQSVGRLPGIRWGTPPAISTKATGAARPCAVPGAVAFFRSPNPTTEPFASPRQAPCLPVHGPKEENTGPWDLEETSRVAVPQCVPSLDWQRNPGRRTLWCPPGLGAPALVLGLESEGGWVLPLVKNWGRVLG